MASNTTRNKSKTSSATSPRVARQAKASAGEHESLDERNALRTRENASESVGARKSVKTKDGREGCGEVRFTIAYPDTKAGRSEWSRRYGLNAYYAGKHWAQRREDAAMWHDLVHVELWRQHINAIFTVPVELFFIWNDNLDCSNHAVMGKMIEDALVSVGMIADDDRRHVAGIHHTYHDKPYIGVVVRAKE